MGTPKRRPGRPGNGLTAIVPRTRVRPEHLAALERRIPKGGTMSDALRLILTEERDRQRTEHMEAGR